MFLTEDIECNDALLLSSIPLEKKHASRENETFQSLVTNNKTVIKRTNDNNTIIF